MLAPRKKLWSTPPEVVSKAVELLNLKESDTFFDIGCGEGRVLIEASRESSCNCIGVEIDEDRAKVAERNIDSAGATEMCTVITGNGLEQDYSSADKIFLYLVPRGLRIILPILLELRRDITVVTYMSPFPEPMSPIKVEHVETANHHGAKWPLYLYKINHDDIDVLYRKDKDVNDCEICNIKILCPMC
jgi:tRNA A58 N-methylase Trm61